MTSAAFLSIETFAAISSCSALVNETCTIKLINPIETKNAHSTVDTGNICFVPTSPSINTAATNVEKKPVRLKTDKMTDQWRSENTGSGID